MTDLHPPHDDSYVVSGYELIAGEYPFTRDEPAGRGRLEAVLAAGVTCFVDLTEEDEVAFLRPYAPSIPAISGDVAVRHIRLSIPDMGVPAAAIMVRILDVLDDALAVGERVYLHCWGGVGRTGTVVGCFLVRHGLAGDAALVEVERLFGTMSPSKVEAHVRSPETEAQCEFVRRWREPATPRPPVVA